MDTDHPALLIDESVCIGCSHCIKVCPTEALRVRGGKARLHADWCIDCGACLAACPSRAIRLADDDSHLVARFRKNILLVPGVFFAQFETGISEEDICRILGSFGFNEICRVEQSVDTIIPEIRDCIRNAPEKPVISSFCPAVIRLIQVRFPSLVDRILPLMPPLEVTARYYRNRAVEAGEDPDSVGLFYLTPCIGKTAAVKAPVGGYESPIRGIINMDRMYNRVLKAWKNREVPQTEPRTAAHLRREISCNGSRWPTTGGEARAIGGSTLSIDGMTNVIEFLEMLENEEIGIPVDYLELRGCDESCAGGLLTSGNRFLVARRIREEARRLPERHLLAGDYDRLTSSVIRMEPIQPRSLTRYDRDITRALDKMERARRVHRLLPDIDCGACGAPSCEAFAADVVRGQTDFHNCLFLQIRFGKEGSITFEEAIARMESVWGTDRFTRPDERQTQND